MATKPKGPLYWAREGVKEYDRWKKRADADPENGSYSRSSIVRGKMTPNEEKSYDKSFDHGSHWVEYESRAKRDEQKDKRLHQYGAGTDMRKLGAGKKHGE